MQTNDAVREIIGNAGMSAYSASLALGKAHSYMTSLLKRKGGIGAPVLATIADACGYDLMLVPRDGGEPIVIDGSRSQDASSADDQS